jgi:DNA-binding transcriptional MerR regulator
MVNGKLTTAEAAKKADIHLATLQRWIAAGKVAAPKATLIGAVGYRLWSSKDVERLKKVKEGIYRKGRGRKPKPKAKR